MFSSLGGKRFLKIIWVLILQIFLVKANIVVSKLSRSLKFSKNAPIVQ